MTRDRIQHALNIIYEKVFNLGQADLYPGLVSGPYLQHNVTGQPVCGWRQLYP